MNMVSTYLVGGKLNGKIVELPEAWPHVIVEGECYELGLHGPNGFRYYAETAPAGARLAPRAQREVRAAVGASGWVGRGQDKPQAATGWVGAAQVNAPANNGWIGRK